MSEGLPKEIDTQLTRFEKALEKLDNIVEGFCSRDPKQVDASRTPLQRAQTHLLVAQGLLSASTMYLRVHGLETSKHPVQKEAERLKVYGKKLRRLESEDYLAKTRPTLEVNIAAANRFIDHAIPDLSKDQKQALKQVGKDYQQQGSKRKQGDGKADAAEMARAFLEEAFGKPGHAKKKR